MAGRSPLRGSGLRPDGLSQSSLSQAKPLVPNAGDPPPLYPFETIAIWLRNIGTEDELPAPVEEVAHLLSEIERLEDKCNQQAMMLQRLFPDRNAGVYFICGEGGEKDTNGLPDRIHVCPAYGCGWSEIYSRAAQGIDARQRQDAKRLDPEDESPTPEGGCAQ